MAYLITLTDGQILASVANYTIDITHTSIALPGQGYPNWGQYFINGLVNHLENFSGTTAPNYPLQGQLWWDSATQVMNVYNSSDWVPVSPNNSATIENIITSVGLTSAGSLNPYTSTYYLVDGQSIETNLSLLDAAVHEAGGAALPTFFTASDQPTFNTGASTDTLPNTVDSFYGSDKINFNAVIVTGPNGILINSQTFSETGDQTGLTNYGGSLNIVNISPDIFQITVPNATTGNYIQLVPNEEFEVSLGASSGMSASSIQFSAYTFEVATGYGMEMMLFPGGMSISGPNFGETYFQSENGASTEFQNSGDVYFNNSGAVGFYNSGTFNFEGNTDSSFEFTGDANVTISGDASLILEGAQMVMEDTSINVYFTDNNYFSAYNDGLSLYFNSDTTLVDANADFFLISDTGINFHYNNNTSFFILTPTLLSVPALTAAQIDATSSSTIAVSSSLTLGSNVVSAIGGAMWFAPNVTTLTNLTISSYTGLPPGVFGYASDCCNPGEATGAGTGSMVFLNNNSVVCAVWSGIAATN